MTDDRKVVKRWLRTMDREEYETVLHTALFTSDELRYIHMRCVEGKSFKEIAIDQGLSRRAMCEISKRIAQKMHKAITKLGYEEHD